jgi:hypothetical protein
MAEVVHLLDRGNRIIDVGLETTLEGSSVFSVRFEGENVEDDHTSYLTFPTCSLSRLRFAFQEIAKAARDKERARETAGGRL